MSKVFQVWAKGRNAADLMQLHFPIYSLSACCVTSLNMSSVEQGQVQEQTTLEQDCFCPLAQNSRADCAHVTRLKAFSNNRNTQMLHVHLALQCQSQTLQTVFLEQTQSFLDILDSRYMFPRTH